MSVSAAAIKELRDKTNAGVMDCRTALEEASGDVEKAEVILKKKGAASAEKRAGRETGQGLVEAYIHPGGRFGALVELNCETDFVARSETFRTLARELVMHITAVGPQFVDLSSVPEAEVAEKREELRTEALAEGKPEGVVDKMVEGRMKRYAEETCLLDQPWVKDPDKTVRELVQETVAMTQENIQVRRFARYQLGA